MADGARTAGGDEYASILSDSNFHAAYPTAYSKTTEQATAFRPCTVPNQNNRRKNSRD